MKIFNMGPMACLCNIRVFKYHRLLKCLVHIELMPLELKLKSERDFQLLFLNITVC